MNTTIPNQLLSQASITLNSQLGFQKPHSLLAINSLPFYISYLHSNLWHPNAYHSRNKQLIFNPNQSLQYIVSNPHSDIIEKFSLLFVEITFVSFLASVYPTGFNNPIAFLSNIIHKNTSPLSSSKPKVASPMQMELVLKSISSPSVYMTLKYST